MWFVAALREACSSGVGYSHWRQTSAGYCDHLTGTGSLYCVCACKPKTVAADWKQNTTACNLAVEDLVITRSTGTVHTSAKALLTSVVIGSGSVSRPVSGSPPKFSHFFIGLPCKFHANPFESFCTVANRETYKQWQLHIPILLGEGNNLTYQCTSNVNFSDT